jgi:aspartate kinase
MKVFKFGGASVKDADAVRNVAKILRNYSRDNLVVVVSAMGKTTNALEKVVAAWHAESPELSGYVQEVVNYHETITTALFPDSNHSIHASFRTLLRQLQAILASDHPDNFDYAYDQVVSFGELFSTAIVHHFLQSEGLDSNLYDARKLIRTDDTYREGKVDWAETAILINKTLLPIFALPREQIALTQGFIGSSPEGHTTTLGREGSDYSAAIFAYMLEAEEMIIWKDVPGLLNADPKYFSITERLANISYREAIELSYYGATIIHPKTLKPLQNKDIPLRVKSFVNPEGEGSLIYHDTSSDSLIPSFIFKVNQTLLSISPRDFSFIDERNLSEILGIFARLNIHIHLMQNSALSFSVCMDNNERRLIQLYEELGHKFKIRYNTGLELITIRHYDQATIDRVLEDNKIVLLEMRTRLTAQLVVRPIFSNAEHGTGG